MTSTEGQIVLGRELHRCGVDPPVDVLPSLSRMMNSGIGEGRTREDHRPVADQLFALVARSREVRQLSGSSARPDCPTRIAGWKET